MMLADPYSNVSGIQKNFQTTVTPWDPKLIVNVHVLKVRGAVTEILMTKYKSPMMWKWEGKKREICN